MYSVESKLNIPFIGNTIKRKIDANEIHIKENLTTKIKKVIIIIIITGIDMTI
ncbi:hypothetical protein [Francisella tularensis]|uniref:hypothetical protein n=1 Tax=Francisella tularensis TaxID=263 RepID=UPI002381C19F|nr:hypothetical protein [Francisella tularensis]